MFKKTCSAFLIVTQLFAFNGCATIVSGKSQDITVRSTPPGADILIDGTVAGTTPMVVNLVRKKRHEIQLKKAGYSDVSRATTRGFNWWFLGNLIFGGIIGLIVDPITGSMFSVKPEEIHVEFEKEKELEKPAAEIKE